MQELIFTLLNIVIITTGYCESPTMKGFTVLPNKIYICENKSFTGSDLVHELWHIFYYETLSNTDRNIYKFLYNYCSDTKCFSRNYWMKNEIEDFATAFELLYYFNIINWGNYSSLENNILRLKLKYIEYLIEKYWQ